MEQWLTPACDYVQSWLAFQMRVSELPGCIVAIMHRDCLVLEAAYGYADTVRQEPLTVRSPVPDRVTFQELYRSRNHEAARSRPAAIG